MLVIHTGCAAQLRGITAELGWFTESCSDALQWVLELVCTCKRKERVRLVNAFCPLVAVYCHNAVDGSAVMGWLGLGLECCSRRFGAWISIA